MTNISKFLLLSLLLSSCGNMYGSGNKVKTDTSNVQKSLRDHVGNVSQNAAISRELSKISLDKLSRTNN